MANATATVKGGFWEYNNVPSLTGIATTNAQKRRVAQRLAAKGTMGLRALAIALNGAAPGTVATKTLARIAADTELGGRRTIETETLVNRASTTADRDELNTDLFALTTRTSFGGSPVANGDGNPLGTR